MLRSLLPLVVLLTLIPSAVVSAPDAQTDVSWVDLPLDAVPAWSQPGADLPAPTSEPAVNPRCGASARWAETPQDQALVDAGWQLFSPYQAGWGIVVVGAKSGDDGMCRPLGYQYVVFVDGVLAGTISPDAMNPRATGAGSITAVRQDGVSARFLRYAPTDPLCCPSRGAVNVDYRVDRGPDGPVLVPYRRFEEPAPGGA